MRMDIENPVEKINANLPADILVLAVKKATKNFDSKNNCSYRTYEYVTPTYAFAQVEEVGRNVLHSHMPMLMLVILMFLPRCGRSWEMSYIPAMSACI